MALNAISTCTQNLVPCQEDLQNRLVWGPLKMRNAIKGCVENGYLKVTKPRDKKGGFTPNEFEFDLSGGYLTTYDQKADQNEEIKPTQNQYKPGDGNRRVAKQPLPCSKDMTISKETTATCSAAVFSGLDIEESEKAWLCKEYDQKTIADAVFYATHPTTKIKKPLTTMIKWACRNKIKYQPLQSALDFINKNILL